MKTNPIFNVDGYKASHEYQYPPGTEYIFSYIESRGGKYPKTVFLGSQAYIKEYLLKPITMRDIEEAEEFFKVYGEPFNKQGWLDMLSEYNGYYPLEIKAAPEGTVIPVHNALTTVVNTDKKYRWATSYIETSYLRAIWYPTTVATISYTIRNIIRSYLEKTGDVNELDFKLHDFGARGVSSNESSALGGMAHLATGFKGSDTISGIIAAQRYYNADMAGFSIPAAEHSAITSWGRAGEEDAYRNMINQFSNDYSAIAVVSDSYDIDEAVKMWGTTLKQEVIDSGAMIIIRPDSGDPTEVVTRIIQSLDSYYGSVTNVKGYKVLNNVRVLQGDGIDEDTIEDILFSITELGYSADNLAFGMGGALLQRMDRDTQRFAMKASAAYINGKWVDVFKDPVTDKGKRSKKGRLMLYTNGFEYTTAREDKGPQKWSDLPWEPVLRTIYKNGKLIVDDDFETIRARSNP